MADYKDDIEKYRKGELTSAEMHNLEKRALSDPFLADALEGADSILSENFSTDILEINKKIQSNGNKSVWFTPLRIAAGIVLLVGSVFLIYNFSQPDEQLALQKEEQSKQGTINIEDTIVRKDQQQLLSPNQLKEETKSEMIPDVKTTGPLAKTDGSGEVKPGAGISTTIQTAPSSADDQIADQAIGAELTEIRPEEKSLEKEKIVAAEPSQQDLKKENNDFVIQSQARKSKLNDEVQHQKVVRGRVTRAEDALPLPGVSVSVKGSTIGTLTDMQGNYSISIKSDTQKLVFSFSGLETSEVSLQGNPTQNVTLQEDPSYMSEVVIMGTMTTHDDKDIPVIKLAEPAGGRKAYDTYLENNLRYPQQVLESNIKGKVTIEFTVGKNGALRNFSIMKSMGYGCDEEVMRLVKEGPKWTPGQEDTVPIESLVRVKIKFDPEKAKK